MRTDIERAAQAARTTDDWTALLRASALALVALLLCAAGGFRDLEAAAMAVGGVVAFALLRYRTGLVGELALGALFANVGAWMVPGAISNLRHHENWVASALPASLAIVSIAGLVAVAARLARRRVPVPASTVPRVVGAVAVVLVAAANIAGAVGEASGHLETRPGDLIVTAQHVKFDDTTLDATPGRVGVVLNNLDLFWHTFTIKELGVNLNVPVQAERRIEFDAPAGTYAFVCKIPGHEQAGMKGTLVVSDRR